MPICFRDQTFCSSDCKRDTCHRFWTDELHQQARNWWSHEPDNAPVAFSDFSETCPEYLKP